VVESVSDADGLAPYVSKSIAEHFGDPNRVRLYVIRFAEGVRNVVAPDTGVSVGDLVRFNTTHWIHPSHGSTAASESATAVELVDGLDRV
jgi:hypothetical protein